MSFRKIWLLVAVGALVGVPTALGSGSALPKLPTQIGPPGKGDLNAKPTSITYTGDGSGFFAGGPKANNRAKPLDWSSWTATGGQGSGFNWLNDCTPNCAGGTFHRFAVKLDAYSPKHLGGHLVFTRMKVTYTGKMPKHATSTQLWKVVYQSHGYFYDFPPGG